MGTDTGLTLRPWAESDLEAVRDAFNEPLMLRQLPPSMRRTAVDDEMAGRWIADRRREREEDAGYSWAVTHGPVVVGCVAVGAVDRVHDTGWVSYWTVRAAQGRGVASSALRAAAGWAFGELGLFRLELGHRTDNRASCEVAGRAGFAVEGLQRAKLRYGGTRHDVELHSRLATDS
ncbi:GNAT family protein [Streptomyces sodiiphilus]